MMIIQHPLSRRAVNGSPRKRASLAGAARIANALFAAS